jgi:hypothetical protein
VASAFDAFATFLNSPAGPLVVGGGLFYGIQKFFKEVEDKLTDSTKLQIAVWLLGIRTGPRVESWPETFAAVFDRVFGKKHLSWKCFFRSSVASITVGLLAFLIWTITTLGVEYLSVSLHVVQYSSTPEWQRIAAYQTATHLGFSSQNATFVAACLLMAILSNAIPDFISLLETRWILNLMKRSGPTLIGALLVIDVALTLSTAWGWNTVMGGMRLPPTEIDFPSTPVLINRAVWLVYPALFTSVWLWLYAGSGFAIKAARRLDIGFGWFNRTFDIEKKPLQSIGLVAAFLVTVTYWSWTFGIRLLK